MYVIFSFRLNKNETVILLIQLQCMFIVAIIPLMFSPGINGGECKSIRSAGGASVFPLTVVRPGAPVGGESWGVGALPLADAWEDGPASVGATEPEVPPPLSGLILLLFLLLLRPLLGYSIMQSGE